MGTGLKLRVSILYQETYKVLYEMFSKLKNKVKFSYSAHAKLDSLKGYMFCFIATNI